MSDEHPPANGQSVRDEIVALLPRLRRFCMALARSADAGDDLAQATVERALGRIGQWQAETRLDSWMFKIARNIFIDQLRAQQRRGIATGIEALETMAGEDGRTVTETRSDLARAGQAIAALPEDQRALVALVIVEGQSYKEAATVLDIPVGTVMSRLARARKAIDAYVHGDNRVMPA